MFWYESLCHLDVYCELFLIAIKCKIMNRVRYCIIFYYKILNFKIYKTSRFLNRAYPKFIPLACRIY